MKKLNILTICFLFTALYGCKKDDDGLPKATQSGKEVMGAKVDGEVWTNKARFCFACPLSLEATFGNNYLSITGRQDVENNKEITIQLVINNPRSGSTIELLNGYGNPLPSSYARLSNYTNDTQFLEFYTSATKTGRVTITRFDADAKIASGTFEFTGEHTNGSGAVVNVTSGRFDVKYSVRN